MSSQRKHNDNFQQYISLSYSARLYKAIVIFAMLHIVTCIGLPMSQGLFQSLPHQKKHLSHIHRNSDSSTLNIEMTNLENKNYFAQSIMNKDEDDYFHPDTILFHPSDRKTDNFDIDTDNNTYLSFSESAAITASKYPIEPITFNPIQLPETNYQPTFVKHVLHKDLWPVDFVSRKIFVRGEK